MTFAILQYEISKGKSTSLKVRPRQSVLIGASNSADIRLLQTAGVASQHCEVKFDKGKFEIFNLTQDEHSIRVNGSQVGSTDLQDGDCIEIGKNKLTVVLQDNQNAYSQSVDKQITDITTAADTTPNVAVASPVSVGEPVEANGAESAQIISTDDISQKGSQSSSSKDPVFVACGNGIRTIELDSFEERLHPIFKERIEHWEYCVFYNHLASKLKSPVPDPDKVPNLLSDLSGDITESNDLFYETDGDEKMIFKRFRTYAVKKSSILAVVKKGTEELDIANELKFIATWLMNPEGLKFNLLNGTEFLITKIFTFLDVLVFYDTDKKQDLVMFNDFAVNDWDAFVQWVKEYAK
ncbi:MAG: FHA domain-containing protein [Mariniblastus sp.]